MKITNQSQRFLCEVVGMISNLIASIILMWYSPNPPMFYAYIFFIIASILLMGAALSEIIWFYTYVHYILRHRWNRVFKNVAMITIKENFLPQDLIEKVADILETRFKTMNFVGVPVIV